MPMKKISLYRHFDAQGRLLYVGISKNALARMEGHAGSAWYAQIATVTIEHYNSRDSARRAEQEAITSERPAYNKINSIRIPPARVARKRQRPSVNVQRRREVADHPTRYEFAWGQVHALFASFSPAEIAEIEEWCARKAMQQIEGPKISRAAYYAWQQAWDVENRAPGVFGE